jgi:hypothetical protein
MNPLLLFPAGRQTRLKKLSSAVCSMVLHARAPRFVCSALLVMFMGACFADADFTRQEAVWKQGIRLMDSNKVFEGIRLLDSLRMSGYDDARFLSAYARSVFRLFVPQKADSVMPFLQEAPRHSVFDTTTPASLSWNVTRSDQRAYPCFQYKATFVYRKPFSLVFQGLDSMQMPRALLRFHELQPQTPVQSALVGQFSDRRDDANCTVCIDLNDPKSSLMEYIGRRINGVYDSINSQKDLQKYHALSIRCFRRNFFSRTDGSYAAYIVFDRTLADLQTVPSHKRRSTGPDATRKIRFTVAIRSGIDVQVFTEAKLQSILREF